MTGRCEGLGFGSVTTDASSFTHREVFWQRWYGAWRALEVGVLKSLMRDGREKQREKEGSYHRAGN